MEVYRMIKSLCAPDDYNTDNTIITTHVFLAHYLAQSDCLAADRQGPGTLVSH
jgi:hypothetical protein